MNYRLNSLRFRLCQGSRFVRKFENRDSKKTGDTCKIWIRIWRGHPSGKLVKSDDSRVTYVLLESRFYRIFQLPENPGRRISEIKRRKARRVSLALRIRHANCASSSRTLNYPDKRRLWRNIPAALLMRRHHENMRKNRVLVWNFQLD